MANEEKKLTRICVLLAVIGLIMVFYTMPDWWWRVFRPYIGSGQFNVLAEKYDGFVGMGIEEVLDLVTKDDKCFLFTRETVHRGQDYDAIIERYPEMVLTYPRDRLYCIAVYNARSPEETYPRGIFVDEDGIVIEPPIFVGISW